jgi:hypothetical protein
MDKPQNGLAMRIIRVISAWVALRVVDFIISVAAVFVWFPVYFAFISFAGEGKGFCENTNLCAKGSSRWLR